MQKIFLRLCVAFAIVTFASAPALAQRVKDTQLHSKGAHAIAAVVNSDVITNFDLQSRIKLALLSSNMPYTAEAADRLAPQILRGLIDEKLQRQEAKRLDITVAEEEVSQALQKIAADNRIPGGDMRDFLASRGISAKTLTDQISATMGWSKVIQRSLRPKVQVGDDEVDAAVERIAADAGKREYLISEIYLSVDDTKDEDAVRKLALHLVEQIKSGAPFGAVARQFSQNAGAAGGGDIGWIRQGQLASELNTALASAQKGQIIGPVRSASGYHILGIRDAHDVGNEEKREVSFRIIQAMTTANNAATKAEAEDMRKSFAGCTAMNEIKNSHTNWKWMPEEKLTLSKAPSWLSDQLVSLKSGEASLPTATNRGLMMLFVCERNQPNTNIDRNAVMNAIGTEKLELQARTLLRNLRREAYLDVRLGSAAQQ